MHSVVQRFLNVVRPLDLLFLGAFLVTLRYILRTPQPLQSVLPGESRLYRWTRGHVFYKMLGKADAPLNAGVSVATLATTEPPSVKPGEPEESRAAATEPAQGDEARTVDAYCVKCRHKRFMQDPREVVTKNGRRAMEGTCPLCGTKLFRFIAN